MSTAPHTRIIELGGSRITKIARNCEVQGGGLRGRHFVTGIERGRQAKLTADICRRPVRENKEESTGR
jgi:hypothetical protein